MKYVVLIHNCSLLFIDYKILGDWWVIVFLHLSAIVDIVHEGINCAIVDIVHEDINCTIVDIVHEGTNCTIVDIVHEGTNCAIMDIVHWGY